MKKYYLAALCICLATILAFSFIQDVWHQTPMGAVTKVGFIYAEDESTPNTSNFMRAQLELEQVYGSRIEVLTMNNVREKDIQEPLWEMLYKGCKIIFTNVKSSLTGEMAAQYPDAQICQVSAYGTEQSVVTSNFHTFNGAIYEGSYVCGIAAGMKLRQMLDSGKLQPSEALLGYVGTFGNTEDISAFTAFLLGVHTMAPEASMRVRYTGVRSSYSLEKKTAASLLEEGCRIIAQGTYTIGPAIACQEATKKTEVYHVGLHENMIDQAQAASLIGARIDWSPYVLGATEAVLDRKPIEKTVDGHFYGNDMWDGFDNGWVKMLELNQQIAAPGTEEKIAAAVKNLQSGSITIFSGNYTGVDPDNPEDTINLRNGYEENSRSSIPTFHYILSDYITIEE